MINGLEGSARLKCATVAGTQSAPAAFREQRFLGALAVSFVGLAANIAWAVSPSSFNCNATHLSATEKKICSDNGLASDDRQLMYVFETAMQKASPSERINLVEEQKAWLEQRNKCGDNWDCIDTAYHRRVYDLQFPPAPFTDRVPPTSSIPPLLTGKWHAFIGPNGLTMKITKSSIDGSTYKVLSIRPEHGNRDPMYIVTMQFRDGRGFIEAQVTQQQVLSGSVSNMFWKTCDSLSALKSDVCSTFALNR